jgi:hypothetical protein
MQETKSVLIYLLMFIAISACDIEKVIPYELPYEGNKLAVWCFIQPNKTVEVTVSPTYPPLGSVTLEIVDDAVVELYENDSLVATLQHTEKGIYTSNFFPIVGKDYHLKVSATDFEGFVVSEKVRIPQKPEILNIDFIDSITISNNNDIEGIMHIEINLREEDNFEFKENSPIFSYFSMRTSSNMIYNNCQEKTVAFNYIQAKLSCLVNENQLVFETKYNINKKPEKLTFQLSTTSNTYLEFYLSADATDIEQGFGFVSEPINVYTNIQGGYGLLAAYNPFEYEFEL